MAKPRAVLPADPLLRQVRLRGGLTACGIGLDEAERRALEGALERAQATGMLTPRAADKLAVRVLGMVPCELWGELFYAGVHA